MNDSSFQVPDTKESNLLPAVSCSEAIQELDYPIELFTPALFMLAAKFDRDPAKEYNALVPESRGKSARPFCLDLQRRHSFFTGLGRIEGTKYFKSADWDRRLYCINSKYAPECFGFIRNIYVVDPRTDFCAASFSYKIFLTDPTALQKKIPVTVFGIASKSFIAYIDVNSKQGFYRHITVRTKAAANQFFTALSRKFLDVNVGSNVFKFYV